MSIPLIRDRYVVAITNMNNTDILPLPTTGREREGAPTPCPSNMLERTQADAPVSKPQEGTFRRVCARAPRGLGLPMGAQGTLDKCRGGTLDAGVLEEETRSEM